jgi:hypothetical protein
MKIDHFCFFFLVCHWKDCWQGCWTEKRYLELETSGEMEPKHSFKSNVPTTAHSNGTTDERAISSSESHKPGFMDSTPSPPSRPAPNLVLPDSINGDDAQDDAQPPNGKLAPETQRLSLGLPPYSPIKVE